MQAGAGGRRKNQAESLEAKEAALKRQLLVDRMKNLVLSTDAEGVVEQAAAAPPRTPGMRSTISLLSLQKRGGPCATP